MNGSGATRRQHGGPSIRPSVGGFTLVELLVVVIVIGVLVGLLLPAVQAARESSRRAVCSNNVKQAAIGLHALHDAQKRLPPAGSFGTGNGVDPAKFSGTNAAAAGVVDGALYWPMAPWTVRILPYIEDLARYNRFDVKQGFNGYMPDSGNGTSASAGSANMEEQKKSNQAFECPSQNTGFRGRGNYYGVQGGGTADFTSSGQSSPFHSNGVLFVNSGVKFSDISDGTSKTLLIGEKSAGGVNPNSFYSSSWASSYRLTWSSVNNCVAVPVGQTTTMINGTSPSGGFSSPHRDGATFALSDASVVYLSRNIDAAVYQSLGIRNDGSPTGGF